jgi:cardiolipin synthase
VDGSADAWGIALSTHGLAIAASVLTYVLTSRSAQARRPPSIAIAWVLGMIALPYLTLPIYLLFGRRKVVRPRPRPRVHAPRPADARHWARILIESFDVPDAAPARVRLHPDGRAARAALLETIGAARRRLDVCTFLIGDDALGRTVAAALLERARAGVRVRLLVDGVGVPFLPRAERARLAAAGVALAVFSPLLARRTSGPRNLRNHRKYAIADGRALWAGGRNFATEYFEGDARRAAWPDLSFDLSGAVAAAAGHQFEEDWRASGGAPDPATPAPAPPDSPSAGAEPPSPDDSLVQFLPSGPDQTEDTVHALLIDACYRAERRILAVTPYFVPDNALESALRLAARRGVAIDVCLPQRSNHVLADFARMRSLRALAAVDVRFHLVPRMTHAKAVVVDDSFALAGSVNLDSRSLLLNYESAFLFYGATEIAWFAGWVDALRQDARPFEPRRPRLWRDVAEGLLLTLGYQL